MKFNDLNLTTNKNPKRVGRGIAAGQGKTAGRGTKGQMSRTGSSKRPGFEGGQNPLMQRLPKLRGFNSHKPKDFIIFTGQLDQFAGQTVDGDLLVKSGLIKHANAYTKLIVSGEVTKKVTVRLQSASASAIKAVTAAGGSFESVERLARVAQGKTKKTVTKKDKSQG